MTDFLRVPEHRVEPEDAVRPRRRSYPEEGPKLDPAVLQIARRLARGSVQTRVARPEGTPAR